MKTRLCAVLASGALIAAGLLMSAPFGGTPVAAAAPVAAHRAASPNGVPIPDPPCSGAGCDNRDPFTTSNPDGACGVATRYNHITAVTRQYVDYAGNRPTLYNLYSTWCNANWAATDDPPGDFLGLVVDTQAGGPYAYAYEPLDLFSRTHFYNGGGAMWTDMVDGTGPVRARIFEPY